MITNSLNGCIVSPMKANNATRSNQRNNNNVFNTIDGGEDMRTAKVRVGTARPQSMNLMGKSYVRRSQ
jgi:hypothetical protein